MTDSAPKADGLNHAENRRPPAGSMVGGRPIRKRGVHRARKRDELWVISEDNHRRMINEIAAGLYNAPCGPNDFFGRLDHERLKKDYPEHNQPLELSGFAAWLPEKKGEP